MTRYDIYGIGAALVDTEIDVTDDELKRMGVEKGHMTLVDAARQTELLRALEGHLVHSTRASGGSAANSIIAASYFGAKTFYSCKVANDDNGHFYLQDLKAAGVDTNFHSPKADGITGKCLVLISPDAERSMNTFLGISAELSTAEINAEAIANSRYVYLEGYLVTSPTGRAAAIATRDIAERHGVKTALSLSDPGMVQFFKSGLQEMIGSGVDLLFCNKEEALQWTGIAGIERAAEALRATARSFAITLGGEGAVVFDGKHLTHITPHPVKAVDTNGAGDMFAGAFLYAINAGYDYASAGRLANIAAATVVSDYGPRLAGPRHREILANFNAS